jgi:uncharacterized peroxidase-related enzyme
MSRIKVIQEDEATGRLKEVYTEIIQKRGKLSEVIKIQSLRAESIVKHIDLYMEIMFSKSQLSRSQREMIAVVVSAHNHCNYCVAHHSEALNNYWKNEKNTEQLSKDFSLLALSEQDKTLCAFAVTITKYPSNSTSNELIEKLRFLGLSDEAILDATLVISYFNFVNRMVLGLGVELEKEKGTGYNY